MPDPYVRRVGEVSDIDERPVIVGVDYDAVSIVIGGMEARLDGAAAADFAELFIRACQEAEANA